MIAIATMTIVATLADDRTEVIAKSTGFGAMGATATPHQFQLGDGDGDIRWLVTKAPITNRHTLSAEEVIETIQRKKSFQASGRQCIEVSGHRSIGVRRRHFVLLGL